MTGATTDATPARYPVRTRILHWLTAILIFTTLLVGFVLVNSLGSYGALVGLHMTLGATILAIVVIRVANRFTHRAPPLPQTVGPAEHLLVIGSELTLYALMLAQPLVGWAMVSASGKAPVHLRRMRGCPGSHRSIRTCISFSARHIQCSHTRSWWLSPLTSARCWCTR